MLNKIWQKSQQHRQDCSRIFLCAKDAVRKSGQIPKKYLLEKSNAEIATQKILDQKERNKKEQK